MQDGPVGTLWRIYEVVCPLCSNPSTNSMPSQGYTLLKTVHYSENGLLGVALRADPSPQNP